MKLIVTLDEFERGTKINHVFYLDENEDSIGYNMIIRRDLLNQLNIDVRFSDGTKKMGGPSSPHEKLPKNLERQSPFEEGIAIYDNTLD